MAGAKNLLDLMTPEDRKKVEERFAQRMARKEIENKISNEVYIVAEFGYYFGWAGVQAIRNNEITIEEAFGLLEGARKVWYTKLCEQGRMTVTAVAAPLAAKGANKVYNDGMKGFVERARI